MNWKEEGEGPTWIPTLNAAEDKYGIPRDLLARIAYQESHFRADIISGSVVSPAGAVGIMQLLPRFFPGAGQSPQADIDTAAKYLCDLYARFKDWTVAVAAYNWGPGSVHQALAKGETLAQFPKETSDYVTDVCGDTNITGVLLS